MIFIGIMDCIGATITVFTIVMVFHKRRQASSQAMGALLLFLLLLILFHGISNSLEWLGISATLDKFEDYVEIMVPLLWGFLLYVILQAIAERDVRKSEEDLRVTLHSIGDAVIATDASGCITRMNEVAEQLTGRSFNEVAGRPFAGCFIILDADTRLPQSDPIAMVLENDTVIELPYRSLIVAADGTERQIADSGAPIRDEEGNKIGVVLVFRDVTEKYRLEEQFRQAQKMDAIGRLAGGVAHDFNNMLAGILGAAEMLQMKSSDGAVVKRNVKRIIDAATHASDLTQKLLAFSRKGTVMTTPINVHAAINDVLDILRGSIDKRVEILTSFDAIEHTIVGNHSHLQNALLNIMINARDAMPAGGILQVTTRNIIIDEDYCRRSPFSIVPDEYIEIKVSDTGVGMDAETQKRIFEPFFTTKDVGKGTGLGLSVVYRTIEDHHGEIQVSSEIDTGTSFKIFLPLVDIAGVEHSDEQQSVITGKGCLLLIDDEVIIRQTMSELLTGIGYEVLVAADGKEAADIVTREKERIDLVILDLVMPKKSGADTFYELRRIHPPLKILLCSGFSRDTNAKELLQHGACGFIEKPYRIGELSRKIAEIITVPPTVC